MPMPKATNMPAANALHYLILLLKIRRRYTWHYKESHNVMHAIGLLLLFICDSNNENIYKKHLKETRKLKCIINSVITQQNT